MTKVKDVEKADAAPEPGWAKALRAGYFKDLSGGGGGSGSGGSATGTSAGKKGAGGNFTTEEELKLLGSPANSTKPKIVPISSSSRGGSPPNDGAKDFLKVTSKDDDELSNNATLTINGLTGLDDHDHTTTYTGTINSLSRIKNRFSSKYGRMRKRVVFKNGDTNLHQTNISKRRRKYLADLFITLVDLQWRWTFLVFAMSFLSSWTSFAAIYWLISYTHGDLEHIGNEDWSPCVNNLHGFTSAFLFSIETQTTIGYGSRYTTEECPEAVFMMCIQSILGTIIQAFMVGVVFTKMSRPKKRTETLMFSRHAVINQRDGNLTLQIRVGDLRDQSHIICASIRAQLIKRRQTAEGEVLPFYQHELKVGVDSDQQAIFFIWPMIVVHKIDSDSPLFLISAEELIKERFEIVLILEGVIESTGATTQARSSYLPSEILWGHRFEPLVSFRKELGEYAVDYSLFNNTYEVDTARCSAKDLYELQSTEADLTARGLRILAPFHVSSTTEETGGGGSGNNNKQGSGDGSGVGTAALGIAIGNSSSEK